MKAILSLFAAASIAAVPVAVQAAPCKDAKGKFTKCPEKKVAPKRCKDAKGKFAKCDTLGAKPI
ncbi:MULTISPECIES: hypothetical protein [unclassified Sphingobium]|uniref:hypothetical protein n=1 Tax=unclassified Sphingobium TaxID=2611147 RepID=UPI000D158232|nr:MULTISPECIES: hypothetical protein [unclassified Sphingobium]PSO12609.1 hypothetical protein C7E20_05730 [Sphingobium sp. AEW4]TWD09787.1 hypothetical protein FB595_104134 [Sphingobium sp. AEW010]TWD26458.1 hypothetical protein FB596_104134 [Sphingobium sp. AEW013]TWD27773.1 hypothetical protein FB594_105194 [Sphingobium sp. AEW001]